VIGKSSRLTLGKCRHGPVFQLFSVTSTAILTIGKPTNHSKNQWAHSPLPLLSSPHSKTKKKKSSEKTKKKVQIPKVAFESTAKDGEEITTKQKRKKI